MDKKEKFKVYNTEMTQSEKEKALAETIAQIEKTYGKGSIMRMTDSVATQVDAIPTGCLALDLALGIGGLPRGRIVEVYGPESSGKTTLALHVIAETQKTGGMVAFIDAEHALDPVYAQHLGIDLSRLYICQPDNGEQALDIAEALVRSSAMDVVVIDSVAALTPQAEINGEIGESHVGLQARLMSQALRKIAGVCNKTKTCIIFINQLREKIGVMYGNPEVTPGGKALKFYASVRLDVRKGEALKDGGNVIGNRTKVKIVKNKLAPPFKTAEFDLIFGKGISNEGCILDMAIDQGLIVKSGSWFSYNDERLGQGRETVKQIILSRPELLEELDGKIRELISQKGGLPFEEGSDTDTDEE
ncbi:MAG: recombinase RecA [Clostridiales bacterium]|nr:recombinase RecA [Clostridiales bacterium]